jgi:hypothetical protein
MCEVLNDPFHARCVRVWVGGGVGGGGGRYLSYSNRGQTRPLLRGRLLLILSSDRTRVDISL